MIIWLNHLSKKIDGFDFDFNDLFRGQKKPYSVLYINKKSQYINGLKYARKKRVNQLRLDLDLTQSELELLESLPLKGLSLSGASSGLDLSFLSDFPELESLSIAFRAKGVIDLSYMRKLEFLNYTAGVEIINFGLSESLKSIHIHELKDDAVPDFGNIGIEEICINNSSISTLDSFSDCSSIQKFNIDFAPKLKSVRGLNRSSESLRELALRNCRSYSDYSFLSAFSELEQLYLLNCGVAESVSFFSNFKKLKYGNIDINVVDGDVRVLLGLPVIFKNYKHFSEKNNLRIKIVTNDGNYLVRGKEVLYKL